MNLAANLIAMLVPANLFREDGCPLENIVLRKKDKKRTLKPRHVEISDFKVNFLASCLKHPHVSSNRNSSYIYGNQESVRRSIAYEPVRACYVLLSADE